VCFFFSRMRFFSISEQFFLDREGVSVPNLCKVRL
jgi:hypothetical protein